MNMRLGQSLHSCLYEGHVRHRRFAPVQREFRYPLFLMYVDLDELPQLFRRRWLWSAGPPNLAWFRRADYLGPRSQSLAESVRQLVAARIGHPPRGPIRLLTHFRYFGVAMNPISVYYCFDDHERLETVVAEVTNTPWGERHCYVLDVRDQTGPLLSGGAQKEMHVSPFLTMDFDYTFCFTVPDAGLFLNIEAWARDLSDPGPTLNATLTLRRHVLDGRQLSRVLLRYPCMTAQVFAVIYWQAFRNWRAQVPFVPHPKSQPQRGAVMTRLNHLSDPTPETRQEEVSR